MQRERRAKARRVTHLGKRRSVQHDFKDLGALHEERVDPRALQNVDVVYSACENMGGGVGVVCV